MNACPASREAVWEHEEKMGDIGCPICGRDAVAHDGECDRCGHVGPTSYAPEYGANFCEPCAADPQADPREETT